MLPILAQFSFQNTGANLQKILRGLIQSRDDHGRIWVLIQRRKLSNVAWGRSQFFVFVAQRTTL